MAPKCRHECRETPLFLIPSPAQVWSGLGYRVEVEHPADFISEDEVPIVIHFAITHLFFGLVSAMTTQGGDRERAYGRCVLGRSWCPS